VRQAAFAALGAGVQAGLTRLVCDNHALVAKMLDKGSVSMCERANERETDRQTDRQTEREREREREM